MSNITISARNHSLVLTKSFAAKAAIFVSDEYNMLQEARRDYPGYKVTVGKSKNKEQKNIYAGLDYTYMEKYIAAHDDDEKSIMAAYMMLRGKSDDALEIQAGAEYAHLQQVRQDYPLYTVVQRHIRKNTKQEHYHGLTYRYMEDYIASHSTEEDRRIYDEKKLISECHSKGFRYPVIKSWFLERFPEIKTFGVPATEEEAEVSVEAPAEAPKLALAS